MKGLPVNEGLFEKDVFLIKHLIDLILRKPGLIVGFIGAFHVDSSEIFLIQLIGIAEYSQTEIHEVQSRAIGGVEIPVLQEIIQHKETLGLDASSDKAKLAATQAILPAFEELVMELVRSHRELATVSRLEAKLHEGSKWVITHEIEMADRDLARGIKLAETSPRLAVVSFFRAWKHSNSAIAESELYARIEK